MINVFSRPLIETAILILGYEDSKAISISNKRRLGDLNSVVAVYQVQNHVEFTDAMVQMIRLCWKCQRKENFVLTLWPEKIRNLININFN